MRSLIIILLPLLSVACGGAPFESASFDELGGESGAGAAGTGGATGEAGDSAGGDTVAGDTSDAGDASFAGSASRGGSAQGGKPSSAGSSGSGAGSGVTGGAAGSAGSGGSSAGTAGAGGTTSEPPVCPGVEPWSFMTYQPGDVVSWVCSGPYAASCPQGERHKFQCKAFENGGFCESAEPGVKNGWDVAWEDKGRCE